MLRDALARNTRNGRVLPYLYPVPLAACHLSPGPFSWQNLMPHWESSLSMHTLFFNFQNILFHQKKKKRPKYFRFSRTAQLHNVRLSTVGPISRFTLNKLKKKTSKIFKVRISIYIFTYFFIF